MPPAIFLDRPYPDHLPVVPSCRECNEAASLDEEYVACLLEVVACGTTEPEDLERKRIASSLRHSSGLRQRLAGALQLDLTPPKLSLEVDRIERVVTKIARGLWNYETSETTADIDAHVRIQFVSEITKSEWDDFVSLRVPDVLPEVGSRMMLRLFAGGLRRNDWVVLQPARFAYGVEVDGPDGRVKMLVRGCLLAEVDLVSDR